MTDNISTISDVVLPVEHYAILDETVPGYDDVAPGSERGIVSVPAGEYPVVGMYVFFDPDDDLEQWWKIKLPAGDIVWIDGDGVPLGS